MFNKQTTLDLDGPKLGFSTDPQDLTVNAGTAATFVAIGTATFPSNIPAKFATNTGIVTYRWYVDDIAVTDDPDTDGFDGVNFLGTGTTTLQIFNNTTTKTVYCEADYIPSAYGLPGVAVTVGSARSTGHAISEPVRSASATLSLNPKLSIDTQPVDRIVAVGVAATFGVDASLTDGSTEGFSYQWQINDSDVSDGELEVGVTRTASAKLTYTQGGNSTEVDFDEISTLTLTVGTYDITVDNDITADLRALGAGGGSSVQRDVAGGAGGLSVGRFTFLKGTTYKLVCGDAGVRVDSGDLNGGGGIGDQIGSGGGGGGGGYTGLFVGSVSQANAVIIAGGGGGGSNDPANGGNGGGERGAAGGNAPGRGGEAGTQSGGGGAGSVSDSGTAGSALQGGPGAGGGGGGYFGGGGGGGHNGCCADGAGGGGSGYIGSPLLSNESTTTGEGAAAARNGSFEITATETSVSVPITLTISGSTSNVLTVSGDATVSATAKVVVSNSNAFNSPLTSESKTFTSTTARALLKIEQYDFTNTATLSDHNLDDGEITFTDDDYPANEICFFAPERDIEIEMELYGGKGITQRGQGGQGGYSKIKFTMERNVEYIITGLYGKNEDNTNRVFTPFVYRKANLIAVVGSGGAGANVNNDGGDGGGISIAGGDGKGPDESGRGGIAYAPGTLPANGVHGSMSPQDPVGDDTKITEFPDYGGRTIPCTRGIYYRDEGFSACEDVGNVKYRISDGTEVLNSAQIQRGFKAGYNIMMTNGGQVGGVNGGRGATGGEAGDNGNGGGGGSGYTDGSVTVLESTLGGGRDEPAVIIRLAGSIETVTFTQSRSSNENIFVKMSLTSGSGPDSIEFGSKPGFSGDLPSTVQADISKGSVYTIDETNNVDSSSLSDGTLTVSDTDSNPGSLEITPDKGEWTSTTTYEF